MRSLTGKEHVHSFQSDLTGIAIFVAVIWVVFVIDRFLPLEQLGMIPRSLRGLMGIVTLPFLHANLQHNYGQHGTIGGVVMFTRRLAR